MDLNHARLPIPPLRHGVLKRRPAKELKHLPRDTSFTNPAGDVNADPLRRPVGPASETQAQIAARWGRTKATFWSHPQGKLGSSEISVPNQTPSNAKSASHHVRLRP